MVKVHDLEIQVGQYPDSTLLLRAPSPAGVQTIEWYYENDAELFTVICLRKHFAHADEVRLFMPYCPHARMDRVKNSCDVFTLKYFAEVINSLNFDRVYILDPHSHVCEALIDRVFTIEPTSQILDAIAYCSPDLLFYPDEGAMKRYSSNSELEYVFGLKRRDWATGQIQGLDVVGNIDKIKGKKVLIIDDICSKGGTFYHSAKKLRELGAAEVYLYITHCENTIFEGELLKTDLIDKIYTTNSIFTKQHEKIEVFEI